MGLHHARQDQIHARPHHGEKAPGRAPYLYRIAEKGLRWLDKAEALMARGFPPRPGKYKLPEEGRYNRLIQPMSPQA
jgi:hypothetical protein